MRARRDYYRGLEMVDEELERMQRLEEQRQYGTRQERYQPRTPVQTTDTISPQPRMSIDHQLRDMAQIEQHVQAPPAQAPRIRDMVQPPVTMQDVERDYRSRVPETVAPQPVVPELSPRSGSIAGVVTRTGVEPAEEMWAETTRRKYGDMFGDIPAEYIGHVGLGVASVLAPIERTARYLSGTGLRVVKSALDTAMFTDQLIRGEVPEGKEKLYNTIQNLNEMIGEQVVKLEDPSEGLIAPHQAAQFELVHQRAAQHSPGAQILVESLHTAVEALSIIAQMWAVGGAKALSGMEQMIKYGMKHGTGVAGMASTKPGGWMGQLINSVEKTLPKKMVQGITETTQMAPAQKAQIFESLRRIGAHGMTTTPGDMKNRLETTAFRLGYNITPYVANALGLGINASRGVDFLLNTGLTSPSYIKAAKEADNFMDFLVFAVPQVLQDGIMARGTRGMPGVQRDNAIRTYAERSGVSFEVAKERLSFMQRAFMELEKIGVEVKEEVERAGKETRELGRLVVAEERGSIDWGFGKDYDKMSWTALQKEAKALGLYAKGDTKESLTEKLKAQEGRIPETVNFKAAVVDKETGERKIIEKAYANKQDFIHDLRRNGYRVNEDKVKEAKEFDRIIAETNAQPRDWKKGLKETEEVKPEPEKVEVKLPDAFVLNGERYQKDSASNRYYKLESSTKTKAPDGPSEKMRGKDIVAYKQIRISEEEYNRLAEQAGGVKPDYSNMERIPMSDVGNAAHGQPAKAVEIYRKYGLWDDRAFQEATGMTLKEFQEKSERLPYGHPELKQGEMFILSVQVKLQNLRANIDKAKPAEFDEAIAGHKIKQVKPEVKPEAEKVEVKPEERPEIKPEERPPVEAEKPAEPEKQKANIEKYQETVKTASPEQLIRTIETFKDPEIRKRVENAKDIVRVAEEELAKRNLKQAPLPILKRIAAEYSRKKKPEDKAFYTTVKNELNRRSSKGYRDAQKYMHEASKEADLTREERLNVAREVLERPELKSTTELDIVDMHKVNRELAKYIGRDYRPKRAEVVTFPEIKDEGQKKEIVKLSNLHSSLYEQFKTKDYASSFLNSQNKLQTMLDYFKNPESKALIGQEHIAALESYQKKGSLNALDYAEAKGVYEATIGYMKGLENDSKLMVDSRRTQVLDNAKQEHSLKYTEIEIQRMMDRGGLTRDEARDILGSKQILPGWSPVKWLRDLLGVRNITLERLALNIEGKAYDIQDIIKGKAEPFLRQLTYGGLHDAATAKLGLQHKVLPELQNLINSDPSAVRDGTALGGNIKNVNRVVIPLEHGSISPTTGKRTGPREVELTVAELSDTVMMAKNDVIRSYIVAEDGGIRTEAHKSAWAKYWRHDEGKRYRITETDLKLMEDTLKSQFPKAHKRMEYIFSLYNGVLKDWVNVETGKFGAPVARIDNYVPAGRSIYDYTTKKLFGGISGTDKMTGLPNLKLGDFGTTTFDAMGLMQERKLRGQPIRVEDMYKKFVLYLEAASDIPAIPVFRNYEKVFDNPDFKRDLDQLGLKTLREQIQTHMEMSATYRAKALSDVEKGTVDLIAKFAGAKLMASPWIAPIQGISLVNAMSELPAKNVVGGIASIRPTKGTYGEMKKWSETEGWGRLVMGNISRSYGEWHEIGKIKTWLTGKKGFFQPHAIRKADTWVVGMTWEMIKSTVKSERPELQGDDHFKLVAKTYEAMVHRNQPSFLPYTRGEITLSRDPFLRAFTMFFSQRNKIFNELYSLPLDLRRALRDADNTEEKLDAWTDSIKRLAAYAIVGPFILQRRDELRDWIKFRANPKDMQSRSVGMLKHLLGTWPVGGTAIQSVIGKVEHGDWSKWHDVNTPVFEAVNDLTTSMAQVWEGIEQMRKDPVYTSGLLEGEEKYYKTFSRAILNFAPVLDIVTGKPFQNYITVARDLGRHISPEAHFMVDHLTRAPNPTTAYKNLWDHIDNGDMDLARREMYMLIHPEMMGRKSDGFKSSFKTYQDKGLYDREVYEKAMELYREVSGEIYSGGRRVTGTPQTKKTEGGVVYRVEKTRH